MVNREFLMQPSVRQAIPPDAFPIEETLESVVPFHHSLPLRQLHPINKFPFLQPIRTKKPSPQLNPRFFVHSWVRRSRSGHRASMGVSDLPYVSESFAFSVLQRPLAVSFPASRSPSSIFWKYTTDSLPSWTWRVWTGFAPIFW